jgi:hypothetical protein
MLIAPSPPTRDISGSFQQSQGWHPTESRSLGADQHHPSYAETTQRKAQRTTSQSTRAGDEGTQSASAQRYTTSTFTYPTPEYPESTGTWQHGSAQTGQSQYSTEQSLEPGVPQYPGPYRPQDQSLYGPQYSGAYVQSPDAMQHNLGGSYDSSLLGTLPGSPAYAQQPGGGYTDESLSGELSSMTLESQYGASLQQNPRSGQQSPSADPRRRDPRKPVRESKDRKSRDEKKYRR